MVAGGGNVGVVTALHLAQLGADVVLVEQSGACCMWAGDIDALDSQIQKDMGIQIDKEFAVEDLLRYNQGKCDQNLIPNGLTTLAYLLTGTRSRCRPRASM